jgi:hypothetical protein
VQSFYFLMAGDGGQLEALQPYKIREFPTLIWYSQGLEVKRWAGFFPDLACPSAVVHQIC